MKHNLVNPSWFYSTSIFAISTPGAVSFDVITPELERLRISFAQGGFLFVANSSVEINKIYLIQ